MKKKKHPKQLLCAAMALAMLLAVMPSYALADGEADEDILSTDDTVITDEDVFGETDAEEDDEYTGEADADEESADAGEAGTEEDAGADEAEDSDSSAEADDSEEPETDGADAEADTETSSDADEAEGSGVLAVSLRTDHGAYISGYTDGTFGPNDALTRAQVAQILYNLLEDQSAGSLPSAWSDVSSDDWYYTAVTVTSSLGFFDADGGSFGPDEEITRGEFVSIVTRLAETAEDIENPFPDVDAGDEYYDAILTAYSLGWITGMDDGTFSPDTALTRAQTVTIFNRILGRTADASVLAADDGLRSFSDVSADAWYYAAVMEAAIDHTADTEDGEEVWTSYTHTYTVTFYYGYVSTTQQVEAGELPDTDAIPTITAAGTTIARWMINGTNVIVDPYTTPITADTIYTAWYSPKLTTEHITYVSGYGDGTFGPDDSLTRAEACQMVYSLLSSQSQGTYYSYFADVTSDDWYYEAVTTLASLNLITATGGNYEPDEAISRGEFAEMISRLTALSHSSNSFSDVDEDSEYYYAILTVSEKGWITGMDDGTFSADTSLTRAQAVTILNRVTGRYGDSDAEYDMDDRYTFTDVTTDHWAFVSIMEAATDHEYTLSGTTETWSSYSHSTTATLNWEDSENVVEAATIILTYSSTYSGDYTQNYNVDYSTQAKEDYVNSKGYSSSTGYLIWVSRACQKVYIFEGSQYNWTLIKTFVCGTGKSSSQTPVGVTYITYKQKSGWTTSSYTVAPVVRFYPGTGYAFHSRLYYPNSSTLKDASIGYPCSHGCVRMLTQDVTYIYNYMPNNTTVVIY